MRSEYPRASIESGEPELRSYVQTVVAYLAGTTRELSIPLDVRASRFQWRVWSALRDIPYGATRSYGEVARAIGRPTAARAVARACATNRVALVIHCHRAMRADGLQGGYRWGEERKRRLLELEAAVAPAT